MTAMPLTPSHPSIAHQLQIPSDTTWCRLCRRRKCSIRLIFIGKYTAYERRGARRQMKLRTTRPLEHFRLGKPTANIQPICYDCSFFREETADAFGRQA